MNKNYIGSSFDSFLEEENILQESEDISYGSIVYSYLNEMNIEYSNATRKLNKTILEANGNYRVINEGFSNFIATCDLFKQFIES